MKLKELAHTFNMSVSDLCKMIGYTQQGLNRILRSERVVYPERFRDALYKLLMISNEIEQKEVDAAREKSQKRFQMLDKLAESKGVQWKPNQEPFDDSPEGILKRARICHCYMTERFEYPGMEQGLCAGLRTMDGDGEHCEICKECRLNYQYNEMHEEAEG